MTEPLKQPDHVVKGFLVEGRLNDRAAFEDMILATSRPAAENYLAEYDFVEGSEVRILPGIGIQTAGVWEFGRLH